MNETLVFGIIIGVAWVVRKTYRLWCGVTEDEEEH